MNNPPKTFLTAEWKHLAMLNFEIAPAMLAPYVPAGTELDLWNGRHLVSVVGFRFLRTRVMGIPIPFHRNFEEINLRFYVRRKADDGWRRGVVFIKAGATTPNAMARPWNIVWNIRAGACGLRSRRDWIARWHNSTARNSQIL